jgi:hypothetical protein
VLLGYIFLAACANTNIGEVLAFVFFLLNIMNQRLLDDFGNTALFFIRQCFDIAEQCLVSKNGSALHGDFLTGTYDVWYMPYSVDSSTARHLVLKMPIERREKSPPTYGGVRCVYDSPHGGG